MAHRPRSPALQPVPPKSLPAPSRPPTGQPTLYFNRKRLRRILQNKRQIQLIYDNQQRHQLTIHQRKYLLKSLNLTSLQQLEPFTPGLFRHFVREYPFELARASGATLRELFDHPDLLTANLIWQSRQYHQAGESKGYGRDHRGFCYMPLAPALERAGFMRYLRSLIAEPKFRRFADLLARYVGDDRFFTYEEFGFEDQTAQHRLIGTRRPNCILLVEKSNLARFSRQQAERLGISLFVSGGVSGLMAAEFFSKDLRRVYTGPVFVIALVDWDPGGATTAHALVDQLARYDYPASANPSCANPAFLLRPQLFTPQEIELFSRALHATNPREAGRIANWVKTTGGIHGQARGIRADCLHPLERLLPQLESWVNSEPSPNCPQESDANPGTRPV